MSSSNSTRAFTSQSCTQNSSKKPDPLSSSSDSDTDIFLKPIAPKPVPPKEDLFSSLEARVLQTMEDFEEEKQDHKRYASSTNPDPQPTSSKAMLAFELENRLLSEEEIEKKEYELFTKYAYSDTPGLMQDIEKIRKMRQHLKYTNPDAYH